MAMADIGVALKSSLTPREEECKIRSCENVGTIFDEDSEVRTSGSTRLLETGNGSSKVSMSISTGYESDVGEGGVSSSKSVCTRMGFCLSDS